MIGNADQSPVTAGLAQSRRAEFWTRSRVELRDWFVRNAASLGELYVGAVEMVYGDKLPGRVRFVCHAVREIRNRLPEVVTGVRGPARLDYPTRMDELSEEWSQNGFDTTVSPAVSDLAGTTPTTEPQEVRMPVKLAQHIGQLIADHRTARISAKQAAERLFESCRHDNRTVGDAQRIAVAEWVRLTKWFMARAHDSGAVDSETDETELVRHFEHFEASLGSLLRQFYTTVETLDEILDKANA